MLVFFCDVRKNTRLHVVNHDRRWLAMLGMPSGLIQFTGIDGVEDWQDFAPARQTDGAVGYDVRACRYLDPISREVCGDFPVIIDPKGFALFGIGVVMAVPPGIDAQVRPRSGLATKHHVMLANGPGTVDPDYRGEIACSMYNAGDEPYQINRGDRIAQLIFTPILLPVLHKVPSRDDLPQTTRADGGFGSTGIGGSGLGTEGYDAALRDLDVYMMELVFAAARRSNCVRGCPLDDDERAKRDEYGRLIGQTRKLGCVIASGDRSIASGYNHQRPGAPLCAEDGCQRDAEGIPSGERLEVCRAIHAETSALTSALLTGVSVQGCTMYCNAEPCLPCATIITSIGLGALVILEGGYSSGAGLDIVRSAGIPVRAVQKKWLHFPLV